MHRPLVYASNQSSPARQASTSVTFDQIDQDISRLVDVPNHTLDMLRFWVQRDARAICFSKLYDEDCAVMALAKDGLLIDAIPVQHRTDRVQMAAVQCNGLALRSCPDASVHVQMAAVAQNGLALQYIREQTATICTTALMQTPEAMQYVDLTCPEGVDAVWPWAFDD